MKSPFRVRFSEQEQELLERRALEEGIFVHGLIRGLVRYGLGLPVPPPVSHAIEHAQAAPPAGHPVA